MKSFSFLIVFAALAAVFGKNPEVHRNRRNAADVREERGAELLAYYEQVGTECPEEKQPADCPLACGFKIMGLLKNGKLDYNRFEYFYMTEGDDDGRIKSCLEKANVHKTECEVQHNFGKCMEEGKISRKLQKGTTVDEESGAVESIFFETITKALNFFKNAMEYFKKFVY